MSHHSKMQTGSLLWQKQENKKVIKTMIIIFLGNEAICQEYVRSAIGLKPGCSLGPREQMNFATAFLDASAIYGSTPKSSEDLR